MSSPFLDLPAELLCHIASEIDFRSDLPRFRLVSPRIASTTSHLLFDTLCINLRCDIIERNLNKLRAIVGGTTPALELTRNLVVFSLALYNHDGPRLPFSCEPPLIDEPEYTAPLSTQQQELENEVLSTLFCALSKLKCVAHVSWSMSEYDSMDSKLAFCKVLVNYQYLRHFVFTQFRVLDHYTSSINQLPFQELKNLETLHISTFTLIETFVTKIPAVLEQSPHLSSLVLHQSVNDSRTGNATDILSLYAGMEKPRHLSVAYYYLQPRNSFIPLVKHLRSLSLRHILDAEHSVDRHNAPLVEFWDLWLQSGHCILEELTVDVVPPSLIAYLKLHPGLRKLNIRKSVFGSEFSEAAGTSFWQEVVPRHAPTLEELVVFDPSGHLSDGWAFDVEKHPQKCIALNMCTKVKRLGLWASDRGIMQDGGDLDDDEYTRRARLLVDNVLKRLPSVEMLKVIYYERYVWHGRYQPREDRCQGLMDALRGGSCSTNSSSRLCYLFLSHNDRVLVDEMTSEGSDTFKRTLEGGNERWDCAQ